MQRRATDSTGAAMLAAQRNTDAQQTAQPVLCTVNMLISTSTASSHHGWLLKQPQPGPAAEGPTCAMAILSGFCTSRYMVHVSTEAVVSWPATSMDSRSSRSCVEDTSSRAAIRNLQEGGRGNAFRQFVYTESLLNV
jgi:hypothetical protein